MWAEQNSYLCMQTMSPGILPLNTVHPWFVTSNTATPSHLKQISCDCQELQDMIQKILMITLRTFIKMLLGITSSQTVTASVTIKRKELYFHSRATEIQNSHILSNIKQHNNLRTSWQKCKLTTTDICCHSVLSRFLHSVYYCFMLLLVCTVHFGSTYLTNTEPA